MVEIQLVDAQVGVDRAGELVDGGAAGQEVLHHLLRHFRGIGRDAARGDAVIAGEDGDARALDARLGAALPGGQPFGDLLQPAERARRLGQLGLAAHHMGLRFEVRSRQVAQDAAHLVERRRRGLEMGRSSRARTILYLLHHDQSQRLPGCSLGPAPLVVRRVAAGLQGTGELLHRCVVRPGWTGAGAPRWPLADVLPVLPFIGAAVGLAAGLVFAIVRGLTGPGWLAAVLAVGAAVLITRALHEDGLADTADGLGPHALEPPRRLEIMRDSRNGTFGVLALALSVLIKVACLAQFSAPPGWWC